MKIYIRTVRLHGDIKRLEACVLQKKTTSTDKEVRCCVGGTGTEREPRLNKNILRSKVLMSGRARE